MVYLLNMDFSIVLINDLGSILMHLFSVELFDTFKIDMILENLWKVLRLILLLKISGELDMMTFIISVWR